MRRYGKAMACRMFERFFVASVLITVIERKTPEIFAAQIKALLERPDATPLLGQMTGVATFTPGPGYR